MTSSAPPSASSSGKRNTRLYGRRVGRPLRRGRQALVETLLPRLRVPLIEGTRLDLAALFPSARDVWIELGFGAGEHLAWQAAHHPDVGFLGAEVFINGVASLLRHVDAQALANVRIADTDSFRLLTALPDVSIGRAFLLFPDPWPKLRHHRRRFVRSDTLDLLARVLRPGGELRFATDHADYCAWALRHILSHGSFSWQAERAADWRERPSDWPATRYEERAVAAGRRPVFLAFHRRSPA